MEDSIQKIIEYMVIGVVGFVAKYIIDMKKSLDAAHSKIRDLESRVKDGD